MTPPDTRVDERNRKEISWSVAELHRLEPNADVGTIQDLVQSAHDELMPAKLHHYVPILLVHQVRDIIRRGHPAGA